MDSFLQNLEETLESPDLPEKDEWTEGEEIEVIWSREIAGHRVEYICLWQDGCTYQFEIDEVPLEMMVVSDDHLKAKQEVADALGVDVDKLKETFEMITRYPNHLNRGLEEALESPDLPESDRWVDEEILSSLDNAERLLKFIEDEKIKKGYILDDYNVDMATHFLGIAAGVASEEWYDTDRDRFTSLIERLRVARKYKDEAGWLTHNFYPPVSESMEPDEKSGDFGLAIINDVSKLTDMILELPDNHYTEDRDDFDLEYASEAVESFLGNYDLTTFGVISQYWGAEDPPGDYFTGILIDIAGHRHFQIWGLQIRALISSKIELSYDGPEDIKPWLSTRDENIRNLLEPYF